MVTREAPACVGMLRDAPDQGDGVERRGHDQFLAGLQPKPDANGDFRQAVEKLGMGCGIRQVPDLFVHDPRLSQVE